MMPGVPVVAVRYAAGIAEHFVLPCAVAIVAMHVPVVAEENVPVAVV
jgi:hypothetical protein